MKKGEIQIVNRKARFDYEISENFEAGLVLTGDEIKMVRDSRVNLAGSYVKILDDEAYWVGGTINVLGGDIQRTRKLLLHRDQIGRLLGKTAEQGQTLVPLKLYLVRGRAKLLVGVGKGMKKFDKRAKIKERDTTREVERNA